MSETVETAIDTVVDQVPVVIPEMPSSVLAAFCDDIAQKVHDYATIARRYGFIDDAQLFEFLRDNPAVAKRIKEKRAIWESDENVDGRLRKLAGHALLEALPDTAQLMFQVDKPAVALDAMKAHARIAGVDGLPPGSGRDSGVSGGPTNRFSVNIVFSRAGKAETITAVAEPPTIEGEAA